MVKQTIQIFARVKPSVRKQQQGIYSIEEDEKLTPSLEILLPRDLADGFVNNKRESYKFRFQRIFDQDAKQEIIFEIIAKPVAESVLAGYNGTIFAYGQTGSGKTFTITGGAERYSDRGIIPRTLSYIFEQLQKDSSKVYTTHISYLEIYNECGYDLLDPRHEASKLEDLPKVTTLEDPDQNIHLRNLSLHQATTEEEALNLLFLGDTNRMIAETLRLEGTPLTWVTPSAGSLHKDSGRKKGLISACLPSPCQHIRSFTGTGADFSGTPAHTADQLRHPASWG